MISLQFCAFLAKTGRAATGGLALSAILLTGPASAAETVVFKATYAISISGLGIGRAEAESRFVGNSYAAAVSGSTSGASRLVSDASAKLAGSGRFIGSKVIPSTYNLQTLENGFATHVRMAMASGKVTDLEALPALRPMPDRVPLTAGHKVNTVDPLSAFLVPLDRPGLPIGRRACARTVKVFDGWTRYDIQLSYKDTRAVDGGPDTYSGRVIVCSARYVPVAGHRANRGSATSMASNDRLEVWLAPLKGLPMLVPYRMLIGTDLGDLIIYATRFSVEKEERRADMK